MKSIYILRIKEKYGSVLLNQSPDLDFSLFIYLFFKSIIQLNIFINFI